MAAEFILCLNRQGKVRLSKWYNEKLTIENQRDLINKIHRLLTNNVGNSKMNNSNIINKFENKYKLIFKKYNGLYFIICVKLDDNELYYLQSIPLFVELLDLYFENVSELDLIFNFYKMYRVLDQIFINGELITTNKETILFNLKLID